MNVWCTCCGMAVLISLMTESESPRTVFELLYTHCSELPADSSLTTAATFTAMRCTGSLASFNRRNFWSTTYTLPGTKSAPWQYNTELHPDITHSSLAEQKKRAIRHIEGQSAYMTQPTFLFYTRYSVNLPSKEESKKRSLASLMHRGPTWRL